LASASRHRGRREGRPRKRLNGAEQMAKSHKHAGLQLLATTTLTDADIARLAKDAADRSAPKALQWSSVRLEKTQPGFLVFSVRGPGGLVEQLEFALEAVAESGTTKLRSTITHYKQSQSSFAGIIPMGPKKMLGLAAYRKWIQNFSAALRGADPGTQIDVNGPLTASVGEWL
jgi:hypothetical protein